ncbi:MAG: hypothetical protein K0A89_10790, partial [ANME-2 cluster archaeon]|nr:hypothetical protein [ANME-2 cluster archaeon]
MNESNTCTDCHIVGENGFYERHRSTSDCTDCHFANTTQTFSLNVSLYAHDHNLSVEHSYYEYNTSGGIPLTSNNGTGLGMFPYYSCTMASCHSHSSDLKVEDAAESWFDSAHANSRSGASDSKQSCAKCKSPLNYDATILSNTTIAEEDWKGIQCRVCHNLHDRRFPNNTGDRNVPGPLAFYNATASSYVNYSVYDQVTDATELCEKCHQPGSSHDTKFAGSHKDTFGFTCITCHMSESSDELHTFEVINSTSAVTGCEVCHEPADHTFSSSAAHTGKVDCLGCHDQTYTQPNATGYAVTADGNYGVWNDSGNITTWHLSHGSEATFKPHNIDRDVNCAKCHGAKSAITDLEIASAGVFDCADCHASYGTAVNTTNHNQSLNPGAPNCTDCHTGYEPVGGHSTGTKGYIVNESNTCRKAGCHVDYENGFYERHSSSADCTDCHFANTTQTFGLNASLYAHDHNLVVEHSYYEYNTSGGMPLAINGGTGVGMFPQYTCSLPCHSTRSPEKVDLASSTWLNSSHADSRSGASDSNVNCAKCKSPLNYNASILDPKNVSIAIEDWKGIQCRVCHNLHDRGYPNNTGTSGAPIAFYNATASSYTNYSVYDEISNNTELCEKCHQPGGSHDTKFAGTHRDTLGFDCTDCHMNASFSRGMHEFKVENTTSAETGCEVCHRAEDHTAAFTLTHSDTVDCLGCHDQMYTAPNATGYAVTADGNYGVWNDSGIVTTWHVSHGSPATFKPHNITRDVYCDKCHGATSVATELLIAPVLGDISGLDCLAAGCHNQSSQPVDVVVFEASGHGNLNFDATNTSPLVNNVSKACWLCHGNGSEPDPSDHNLFNVTQYPPKSCDNATDCHGNTSLSINITSHWSNAGTQYVKTSSTITGESCHGLTGVTVFNESVQGGTANMSNMPGGATNVVAHYVKNLTANDDHSVIDTVGWGPSGSQGCVYCHQTDNGTLFNATRISHAADGNCYGCHIVGTTTLHDQGVINGSSGNPDCLGCHGDTGGELNQDVNVSAFSSSVHANLNSNATNVTILNNTMSKACWACHGNGSEPNNEHPSAPLSATNPANTTYPLDCTDGDCHVNGRPNGSTFNDTIPVAIEHVPSGLNDSTDLTTGYNCSASCHNNSLTPHIEPFNGTRSETDLSNVSHYGNLSTVSISAVQPTTDCTLCHKNTTNAPSWGNATQIRHPAANSSGSFCANCHGTDTTFHAENLSSASDIHTFGFDWEGDGIDYDTPPVPPLLPQNMEGCFACHNGTVDFWTMVPGQVDDATTRICEECHYNNSAGPFTTNISIRADISSAIPRVFNHINNSNATVGVSDMSQYFSSTTKIATPSSCYSYNISTGAGTCHGVSYANNSSGNYAFKRLWSADDDAMRPYRWTQTIDQMPNTSDCRICHLGANSSVGTLVDSAYWGYPMNITSTAPTVTTHINASAEASDCWTCHVVGGGQPIDFHDVNITAGGGSDCISCHNVGSTTATRLVNVSAINGSLNSNASIHRAINNATTGTGGSTGNPDNQLCWACHQSDGSEPSGMGDIYSTPYRCYDCHNGTAAYTNVSNAPVVYQHFVNGSALKAASNATDNSSSCVVCHNLTEMKVDYTEGTDNYSTNYSLPSHYGKNRTDLRTWSGGVNCSYCHQDPGTNFTVAMANPTFNASVPDHSINASTFGSTSPNCTNSSCHNSGWMHNQSLTKPVLVFENSSFCTACHDGLGYPVTTGAKEMHNGTLNCTECHLFESRDIHGVKYLQQDNTYATSNASAVNCSTCHQDGNSLTNITAAIPGIPDPLYHSNDNDSGNKWNATPYWSTTSEACEYCHNDTKHSIIALGYLAPLSGEITDFTGEICAACHQSGSTYYSSITANLSQMPPEINTSQASTDGTAFYNHSTMSGYTDNKCLSCHQNTSSIPVNTTWFAHDVYAASAINCVSCHDAPIGLVPTNVMVNVSATNNSADSIHY